VIVTAHEVVRPTAGSEIIVGAVWADAAGSLIGGIGVAAFSIVYDTTFKAAADATYATTYDAVYSVLSRSRRQ
jgi:hypothetical protein